MAIMNHLRENSVSEIPGVPGDVSPPPKSSAWRWVLALGLIAGAWFGRSFWLPWIAPGLANGAAVSTKPAARPIPVRTAQVVRKDMDLFINGLGTVTPFKTVTLHSRVDGELVKVLFSEGQMVREGELLAEIDPRPFQTQLDQAEGTLAKDEATLKLAKITLARGQELQKSKSIAQQQLDEEAAQVQQLEGTVQTDEALVANAKLQLTYCRIIAPVSGRIGLRLVDQGNIVHANDVMGMAVITQLEPIAVVFPVSQDEIPRVQKQVHAEKTLTVEAWDRGFGTKLASGKLYALDNQVDPTTGTVKLKAVFDNKDGMLFPNQFVNAKLLVEVKQGAVVVPSAAVQRGPNMTFVYIVGPDEKVDRRTIVVGPAEGAETSIETGLAAGDVVVTDGIDKLKKGATVTTREK
jgi:multidrug efflux system membrane fusion protein